MNEIFLLKLGEIVLKGANKRQFEDKLRQNVRRRMKAYGNFDVYLMQSTVYVDPMDDECHELMKMAFDAFGLTARSYDRILRVARTIADLDDCDNINSDHLAEAIRYRTVNL